MAGSDTSPILEALTQILNEFNVSIRKNKYKTK